MSNYRRPWWLLVNKSARLITTVHEETKDGERVFIIRGEPLVQGLAWLTWGPVAALIVILILTGLAININVQSQGGGTKFLFVAAFLLFPAVAWAIATIVANRLAAKEVIAEREADAKECLIRLGLSTGEFSYRTGDSGQEKNLSFEQIQQVKVTPAIGARDRNAMRLTLRTEQGAIVLLDEALGTQTQKIDLAREIQDALRRYSQKK